MTNKTRTETQMWEEEKTSSTIWPIDADCFETEEYFV
jgi:hypothetical protein